MRIPLLELIGESTKRLQAQGVDDAVVKMHRRICWKYYGFLSSPKFFGTTTARRFIESSTVTAQSKEGRVTRVSCEYIKVMNCLAKEAGLEAKWQMSDFSGNKPLKSVTSSKRILELHDRLAKQLDRGFCEYLSDLGYSPSTLIGYEVIVRSFLHWLKPRRLRAGIQQNHINGFIEYTAPGHAGSIHTLGSAIRLFLTYLDFVGFVDKTTLFVPTVPASHKRIPETLRLEDQETLLSSFDIETGDGARAYAMVLLAIRTGLRSCDILALTLQGINWKNLSLSVVQKKTGMPLVVPLALDAAKAIAHYINTYRPPSNSDTVFLSNKGLQIRDSYPIARGALDKAGVRIGQPKRGFHLFRFTFTANMLSKEVPVDVLSNLLGHANKNSCIPYISYAQESLRCCALPLSDIFADKR